MRLTTMRRLGGSVNADIVIIDGITTGDRVVMGNCKFGDGGGCWDINSIWLGHTTVGGDVARLSRVSARLCVWNYGDVRVKVLQVEGVG
jgi:hypothetical protein